MTTWVFLRGLTREARHWGDFPAQFRAAWVDAAGYELGQNDIVTPDLPGNGRLHDTTSPDRVEAMMEACRGQLREQGRTPPYHLLALSLGGMVAVAWATHHPQECRALVLLSTSLRPYSPFYERLRPRAYPALLKLLFADIEARERGILELTSARATQLQSLLPIWSAYLREYPVSRRSALRQLFAAARFAAPVQPAVPVLILAGADDRLVHPRCSQRLARAWHADFALHPSAGHDLPLDDGDWVAREVSSWLLARAR